MKILKIIGFSLLGLFLLVVIGMIAMGIKPIALNMHTPIAQTDAVALDDYDVVAYHTLGKATKGTKDISLEWKDVTWLFSTEEHKALFENNPEKYTPLCGGYCSLAAASGFAVAGNPESWSIENGQLIIYKDAAVKETALNDLENILVKIDKNWK